MVEEQQVAEEIEERQLMVQARAGCRIAFGELVKRYRSRIYRLALRLTQNHEDAEDILQQTCLKAYERLNQFEGNSRFYTWLVRIAINDCYTKLRSRGESAAISLDEDWQSDGGRPREVASWEGTPEHTYSGREILTVLDKAIDSLPECYRRVIQYEIEGRTLAEMAAGLNLPIPAVKTRIARARTRLREEMVPCSRWCPNYGTNCLTRPCERFFECQRVELSKLTRAA